VVDITQISDLLTPPDITTGSSSSQALNVGLTKPCLEVYFDVEGY